MSSANVGWMFYKETFKKLEDNQYPRDMKEVNDDILDATLVKYNFLQGTHHAMKLKTIYPGLVIGSGYTHSLKENKENFNFGFYFDHTTGMPTIPGSTVKGVLRSLFGQGKNEKYKEQKEAFVKSLLSDECSLSIKEIDNIIFDGKKPDGTSVPIYERDIFYDAIIMHISGDGLFYDDSITPHHQDALKEPIPNRMLKIAPDVMFQFNFNLYDIKDKDGDIILSSEQKEELFLQLLLWHGIGAKTNVGYGQFEEYDDNNLEMFFKHQKKAKNDKEKQTLRPWEKLLFEVSHMDKVNNDMLQKIKKFDAELEDKQSLWMIVEERNQSSSKHYNKIKNYLDIE